MKVRAAVAHGAEKPLCIETVDLAGPKAGEVLVEIKATENCHTDANRPGIPSSAPSRTIGSSTTHKWQRNNSSAAGAPAGGGTAYSPREAYPEAGARSGVWPI